MYLSKKYYECASICNKDINGSKADFFTYYYLGLSNQKLNLIDESIQNLKIALALEDNNTSKKAISSYSNFARYEIATNLRKQRKYKEAFEEIESNLNSNPKYIHHYILKAEIHQDLDNTKDALQSINEGLRIDPSNSDLAKYRDYLVYTFSREQAEKRVNG